MPVWFTELLAVAASLKFTISLNDGTLCFLLNNATDPIFNRFKLTKLPASFPSSTPFCGCLPNTNERRNAYLKRYSFKPPRFFQGF